MEKTSEAASMRAPRSPISLWLTFNSSSRGTLFRKLPEPEFRKRSIRSAPDSNAVIHQTKPIPSSPPHPCCRSDYPSHSATFKACEVRRGYQCHQPFVIEMVVPKGQRFHLGQLRASGQSLQSAVVQLLAVDTKSRPCQSASESIAGGACR